MVIYIIRKDQLLKSTTFLLILNMACGDLVTTTVTSPPLIKFLLVGLAWIPGTFGRLLCKLNLYLVLVALLGCIFSLTGIQIDRLLAVIRPLTHSAWTKWTKVIIPGIWLAAILLPIRHMWHETGVNSYSSSGMNISVCDEKQVPLSIEITLSICFLLPFTVMLMLYPIIVYHLWTRQVPGEPNALQQQRANRMARKITKMIVAVVLSFFVCWAPQFIFVWIHPLARELAATLPWLFPFILWLQVLNSAMNPVLYAIFNESFRLGFKKVIFGSILRKRNGQVMQSARNQNPIQNIALVRFQNSAGLQR